MARDRKAVRRGAGEVDPLWFKDAIVYQLHVRAFMDSNGDGIGDFAGLTEKLDYLRELGVTAVWLLPFYPSPLRDDGYDIADYAGIHPSYGTLPDFRQFLREAHARGLRVITELVVNHTSDQHPWFQAARRAQKGSSKRDFYVWSDDSERYKEARIIFKDFETSNWAWDPVAGAYYWHRFYSHQPDLNYANPEVRRAVARVMDQWLSMGVDGLRLDAVPYLHEREGTSCENLPETHEELKRLRRHIDAHHQGKMLLAEANQWPEDAVAYFGEGDECHMAFHFPLMPRMFMSLRMEDRYPIVDILKQTPAIPDSCQWAVFLRNHDELTLEMVTDEERDYMYRAYANDPQARINLGIRRRLAPLLGNDRRRIELMNGLLFALPGTPILYYGDEIGMGDNIYLGDRNGVRTPMQWSADRNAGFSRANPQRLFLPVIIDPVFNYETVNVEAQHDNPHSLLWWMRRLIALRKRYRCFGRGGLRFLYPSNRKVLAFVRELEDERVLVVANLSRFTQYAALDLAEFQGLQPVEAFGRTALPPVDERPYGLTLGPHAFYWLSLEPARVRAADETLGSAHREAPRLAVAARWGALSKGRGRLGLEERLPAFLSSRRWFGAKARKIRGAELTELIEVEAGGREFRIVFAETSYADGDPDSYLVSLGLSAGERAEELRRAAPQTVLCPVGARGEEALLHGAIREPEFARALLDAVVRRRRLKGERGELVGRPGRGLKQALADAGGQPEPRLLSVEQSNSSILFGRSLILKVFRRLEPGPNPELEIGAFLTEKTGFRNIAPLLGALEYRPRRGEPISVGVLLGFVPNEGDAWRYALDSLSRYFERVRTRSGAEAAAPAVSSPLLELTEGPLPEVAQEVVGTWIESARLLGQRVAELHRALVSRPEDPAFAPEPFTPVYQRALYQSMRNLTEEAFETLRRRSRELPEADREPAARLLERQADVMAGFQAIRSRNVTAMRARHHGDLHLGQVLWTGRDFVIIDFEGEPARALSARRIKRSPLRDVAGMIRSFHYAAFHGLATARAQGQLSPEESVRLEGWTDYWYLWVASAFLRSYAKAAAGAPFLPRSGEELHTLLSVYTLEKAVYELNYELNSRPDWVRLPLRGIHQLLDSLRPPGERR